MSGSRQPRSAISCRGRGLWPPLADGLGRDQQMDRDRRKRYGPHPTACLGWLYYAGNGCFSPSCSRRYPANWPRVRCLPLQCIDTSSWIPDRIGCPPTFFRIYFGPHRKTPATAFWDFSCLHWAQRYRWPPFYSSVSAVGQNNPSVGASAGLCTGPGDRKGTIYSARMRQASRLA